MVVLKWLKDQPPLSDEELASLYITMEDFSAALSVVQPSAKREGFATVPDVTWNDIGALKEVREELQMAILVSMKYMNLHRKKVIKKLVKGNICFLFVLKKLIPQ